MESLTVQVASLAMIIGLNLVVSLLAWSEYSEHKVGFLHYAGLGQSCFTLWNVLSLWLVLYPGQALALSLSTTAFALAALYFLLAPVCADPARKLPVHRAAAAGAVVLLPAVYFSTAVFNVAWLANTALLSISPVVTAGFSRHPFRWPVIIMQLIIALMFVLSAVYFDAGNELAGGLFYLLLGMFTPMLSALYIFASVRLSRRNISERESDYRFFFDTINEVFFRLDDNGVIREVSGSILQFGLMPGEAIGKKLSAYLQEPENFGALLRKAAADGGVFEFNGAFLSGTGPVDCEILCSTVTGDSSGPPHFTGAIRNTHERNLMERQLIEAQRLESMGILAGGMAHDFNNLLQGIISYTEFLQDEKDPDPEKRNRWLKAIMKAATTAGDLCRQLLHYTGKSIERREALNLVDSVREVLDILEPSCPAGVTIDVQLPEAGAMLVGDRSQLGQVILNLIQNAMDAVGDQGRVSVSLAECELDDAPAGHYAKRRNPDPGRYHVLRVEDDGTGIDAGIQDRIFDPFVTTKQGGHGLGLSAVSGIVNSHNGAINFTSVQGEGSVFTVYLPVKGDRNAIVRPVSMPGHKQGMLVLLVEDDEAVMSVACAMLELMGNRVLCASDGVQALAVLAEAGEPVSLVVTDVKMPNMDGIQLAETLRMEYPALPVVLISGFAGDIESLGVFDTMEYQFLRKPFTRDALMSAIDLAVEKKTGT